MIRFMFQEPIHWINLQSSKGDNREGMVEKKSFRKHSRGFTVNLLDKENFPLVPQ